VLGLILQTLTIPRFCRKKHQYFLRNKRAMHVLKSSRGIHKSSHACMNEQGTLEKEVWGIVELKCEGTGLWLASNFINKSNYWAPFLERVSLKSLGEASSPCCTPSIFPAKFDQSGQTPKLSKTRLTRHSNTPNKLRMSSITHSLPPAERDWCLTDTLTD
jgi:hypothetical protein